MQIFVRRGLQVALEFLGNLNRPQPNGISLGRPRCWCMFCAIIRLYVMKAQEDTTAYHAQLRVFARVCVGVRQGRVFGEVGRAHHHAGLRH